MIYGAGLENRPDLVGRLAAGRTLLGCDPRTLRRVRDPALLGASLRGAGFAYPRTLPGRDAPRHAGRWLRKPLRSGGGRGVREWRGGALGAGVVVQERIEGLPCSAAAVADGRSAALLGVSEQLIGRRTLGARGYTWCGNVTPPRLPAPERSALAGTAQAICAHLAAAFGLRGLFGVDLVWDGERAWVVEVNPRPTGSLETIAAAHGVRPFAAHLEGCAGRLPDVRPETRGAAGQGGALRDARTCGLRTRAAGRPAASATSRIPASRSPPAIPSARSSGRDGLRRRCWPTSRRGPPRCAPSSTHARGSMSSPERATCAGCGLVCDDITAVAGAGGGLERLTGTCPLGDAWFAERVAPAPPLARVDGREAELDDRARRGGGAARAGAGAARLRAGADDAARPSARRSRWPRRSAR